MYPELATHSTVEKDILKLFKSVVVKHKARTTEKEYDESDLIKQGILIDPIIFDNLSSAEAKEITDDAISLFGANSTKLNSTFWKKFSDVASMSELELRMHQLLHYMSTYGRSIVGNESTTGLQAYEPDFLKDANIDVQHELVYISAITNDELKEKTKNMLTSGIALKQETNVALLRIIKIQNIKVDFIDEIRNREFMCQLCKELGLVPSIFDEFMRYLNYLITNSTMLIVKDKRSYYNIALELRNNSFRRVAVGNAIEFYAHKYGVEAIAAGYRRYFKFFSVIHKFMTKDTRTIINRANKLSKKKKNRIPRGEAVLDHLENTNFSLNAIKNAAAKATTFKIVKALNSLKVDQPKLYRIRNGKTWLAMGNKIRVDDIKNILLDEIKSRLDWSDKVFYVPEGVDYVVPTSEKTFVGYMPYLSTFEFKGEDAIVGVAWEKECDLDLHTRLLNGISIGYESEHKSNGVLFSGDMTHTNEYGYAAEFDHISHKDFDEPAIIDINNFRDGEDAKIDVFVGPDSVSTNRNQSIVNQLTAKSVLFKDKMDTYDKTLMVVLPTQDGFKAIFTGFNFTNVRTPTNSDLSKTLTQVLIDQAENALSFKDLAIELGAKVVTNFKKFDRLQRPVQKPIKMISDKKTKSVSTKVGKYIKADGTITVPTISKDKSSEKTEFVDLTPSKLTASIFIDLMTEKNK